MKRENDDILFLTYTANELLTALERNMSFLLGILAGTHESTMLYKTDESITLHKAARENLEKDMKTLRKISNLV